MAVKKNELTLDELNNIAGGRKFYEEEWDDYYNANNALTSKLRRLKTQGKAEEARQIRQACEDLFNKWMEDVHTSPEGSDPISYRSYIEQYLDQLTCGTVPIVALLNVKKNSKLLPETVPDGTTDNTAQTAVKEILTAMKEKEMLKDETLEEVTGGVIPKEIEEGLLDFARNWAYLLYVGDGISRRSRDNIKSHTRNCWGCGAAELDMLSYFEKMHVYDVTQEEFVDFVWEHRNEIPYIGQLRIKAVNNNGKKIILKDDDLDKVSGGQEIGVHEFEYGDFHCQNCYYVMGTIAEINEGDVCPQCGHVQTFKNLNNGGSGGNWIVCQVLLNKTN